MSVRSAFGLIPGPAKILAVLNFAIFFYLTFDNHRPMGLGTLIGLAGGTLAGAWLLLVGYVYADAARRDMPRIPWTVLAVLVPNCIGFVLYFVFRKPMLHACSSCGRGVGPDAAFCPHCGQTQMNLGPQPSPKAS